MLDLSRACIGAAKTFCAWYAQQRRNHTGKKIFALGDFTPGMISLNHVSLNTKAAETRRLLKFLSALHGVAMGHGARPLLRMGEALMQMLTYHRGKKIAKLILFHFELILLANG